MSNYQTQIRDFIINNFLFGDGEKLDDTSSLLDNGIVDSTGILELVSFLEETFSIKVNDDELLPENLDSVNNLTAFVEKKSNNN